MATFKAPADFINENVSLLAQRQSSMYAAYLESRPTFTTYYHINKIKSTTDKGLKNVEALNGAYSPIRYNKILGFPLYGIEQIQLQLDEDEEGLNSDYNGEAIILPNTIHPTVDDYFIIEYLDKKYMFRIIKYEYDTIKSNNYYKIEFTLQSVDVDFFADIEKQVVKTYHTKLENLGTHDNVFITSESLDIQGEIKSLYDDLAKEYLETYFDPTRDPYNTPLYVAPGTIWRSDYEYIFDQCLVHFCNQNKLFYRHDTTDAILFYEEPKKFFHVEYGDSIYDLFEHDESDRIADVARFYDLEPGSSMDSIFMYYRDKRVKYLKQYLSPKNFYGSDNSEYIPFSFIEAVHNKKLSELKPLDEFIASYLINKESTEALIELMRIIPHRHYRYNFHNFIFIPLCLYCLAYLYNAVADDGLDNLEYELANETSVENI